MLNDAEVDEMLVDVDAELKDLEACTVAVLKEKCARFQLGQNGLKEELMERVRKFLNGLTEEKSKKRTYKAKRGRESEDDDDDEFDENSYKQVMKVFAPTLKWSSVVQRWDCPATCTSPPMWCVLLWQEQRKEEELVGALGSDGTFLVALQQKWRLAWPAMDQVSMSQLCLYFRHVNTAILQHKKAMSFYMWCRAHWDIVVAPATVITHRLVCATLRAQGRGELASRVERECVLALLPADLTAITTKRTTQGTEEHFTARKDPRLYCRTCNDYFTVFPRERKMDSYKRHNRSHQSPTQTSMKQTKN